jgi:hypothetical protein
VSKLHFRPGVLARRRRLTPSEPPAAAALEGPPAITLIADLRARSRVIVQGMIRSAGNVRVASGPAYHFTLVDGSGELDVLFPGQSDMAGLQPSTRIVAEGMVGSYDSKLALWNPRYAIAPAGRPLQPQARPDGQNLSGWVRATNR